jgi:flagellar basal-body rod protein FlgF
MDNTLYVSLTQQMVLRRQLDTVANNIANGSTVGFKAESLLFAADTRAPAASLERPKPVQFVRDITVMRDFSVGNVQQTGAVFDVALQGEGFFTIQGPDGPLYTRNGAFAVGPNGELVTKNGAPVLAEGGGTIELDPTGAPPTITPDGRVSQAGVEVARLGIVTFPRPGALEKVGDTNWAAPADQVPQAAENPQVLQGALEGSNVKPIIEMTKMMELSRAYENATRLQKTADDMRARAIDRLGKVG